MVRKPVGGELCWDPLHVFVATRGPKLANHVENQYRSRHLLYKCTYVPNMKAVYNVWGHKWKKHIFDCKVGQGDLIVMKL